MTYLITPYHKAIRISDDQFFLVYPTPTYAVVQTTSYRGGSCDLDISPRFVYDDYKCEDAPDRFAKDEAVCYATEWLEDLLVRLSEKPIVIHCTTDGEMFMK